MLGYESQSLVAPTDDYPPVFFATGVPDTRRGYVTLAESQRAPQSAVYAASASNEGAFVARFFIAYRTLSCNAV